MERPTVGVLTNCLAQVQPTSHLPTGTIKGRDINWCSKLLVHVPHILEWRWAISILLCLSFPPCKSINTEGSTPKHGIVLTTKVVFIWKMQLLQIKNSQLLSLTTDGNHHTFSFLFYSPLSLPASFLLVITDIPQCVRWSQPSAVSKGRRLSGSDCTVLWQGVSLDWPLRPPSK